MTDEFRNLIDSGKMRPVRGSLIGVKYRPDLVDAGAGIGKVKGAVTASGLVVLDAVEASPEEALVSSTIVEVLLVGEPPECWRSRFSNIEWDHATNWGAQRVEPGCLVFARGVAQAPLGVSSDYVQLRYDDIAGIGVPLDEPPTALPCIPAPGFLLVKKDEYEDKIGSLFVKPEYVEVISEGAGMWGTVAALPRGDNLIGRDGVEVGTRVLFSRYQLTEYIDLEGGFRLLPYEDILSVAS